MIRNLLISIVLFFSSVAFGQMKLDNVPLQDVLDNIREANHTNVIVCWNVLEQAGVSKDTPITLHIGNVGFHKTLRLVLAQSPTPLAYYFEDGVYTITTQAEADKHMVVRLYPVEDLVIPDPDLSSANPPQMGLASTSSSTPTSASSSPQQRGEALAKLIMEVIRPEIWRDNGGEATIRYYNGQLVVRAPLAVHEAIGGPIK